jgi:anti-anti-sigma factor
MVESFTDIEFGCAYSGRGADGGLLTLTGELDLAGIPELEQGFAEAIGHRLLVLDLRKLNLIDCASLRAIFRQSDCYRDDGRRVVLVRTENSVDRVLRAVEAERLVEVVDEASAHFPPAQPEKPALESINLA